MPLPSSFLPLHIAFLGAPADLAGCHGVLARRDRQSGRERRPLSLYIATQPFGLAPPSLGSVLASQQADTFLIPHKLRLCWMPPPTVSVIPQSALASPLAHPTPYPTRHTPPGKPKLRLVVLGHVDAAKSTLLWLIVP